jgi:hypothetical protein
MAASLKTEMAVYQLLRPIYSGPYSQAALRR